ncbi:MAG: MgtC/SapB family protein [Terriglobales bacterium]
MGDLWARYGPHTPEAALLSRVMLRLVIAAFLGGIIGLEREFKHKPAGLRTNMFICFGSAMFTVMSVALAGEFTGDHTRIAAQIIPGIGFIGAGSILHSRGSVQGLTTAATIFVVASVGMAVGGGFYLIAIFSTLVILIALHMLGWMEARFSLKPLLMTYQVTGENAEEIVGAVNGALEEERRIMQTVQVGRTNSHYRVQFIVDATQKEHDALLNRLRQMPVARSVECMGTQEHE